MSIERIPAASEVMANVPCLSSTRIPVATGVGMVAEGMRKTGLFGDRNHYDRKLAEGKSPMEALRSLKRQLSDVVYRHLLADHRQRLVGRDGQTGTRPKSA